MLRNFAFGKVPVRTRHLYMGPLQVPYSGLVAEARPNEEGARTLTHVNFLGSALPRLGWKTFRAA